MKWRTTMDFYKRNLPHWQPGGAEFFVTCRLAGSLPRDAVELLKQKRKKFRSKNKRSDVSPERKVKFEAELFKFYDQLLDKPSSGPVWLSNDRAARIVMESLRYYDQRYYKLYAFTIMSNHIHLVFRHLKDNYDVNFPVTEIMKSIKSFTGKECNKLLGRSGQFWQAESFDRVIRDEEELENVIFYTLNNPVKAKLISVWEDWPYSYYKPEFL
jgi:REP element-mobilizing transposase RayT